MVANITIVLVLGARKAGERLIASHNSAVESTETGTLFHKARAAQGNVQLLSIHSPKRRFLFHVLETPTTLREIEQKVTADITSAGALNEHVGGIIFMCNEKHLDPRAFPFNVKSEFLGFSGTSLLEKLLVVALVPELSSTAHFASLSRNGAHILDNSDPSVVLPRLLSYVAQGEHARQIQLGEIYRRAAMSVRRDGQQAVILLAGHSGHGKSKTINRLIGHQLLSVGRGVLGSTTKVIQRVEVRNRSNELFSEITVAFDDTPGLEDTTFEDRELNASLLRAYKVMHFKDIYPNVILLVAAWESITPDSQNEPAHFTSALGKTIHALYRSDLVDDQRANIVVVVTKSMSSFHQFDDYKTEKEKNAQWRIEEGRRRGIVTDLQRKMFPRSSPWEIVFIENGGGTDMTAKFRVLPDGMLSHENLYQAIHNIIKRPSSDGSQDLVGIQSLQVLTGAGPLGSLAAATSKVLVNASSRAIAKAGKIATKPLPRSPLEAVQNLVDTYLGSTYDDARGTFGLTNILSTQNAKIDRLKNRPQDFRPLTSPSSPDEAIKDRSRSHYSSDWAFRAAVSQNSACWIMQCTTEIVGDARAELSNDMLNLIGRLPQWSHGAQTKYTQFFTNYGTHVITRLALGGTVRILAYSATDGKPSFMVFRDGGASVAAELTDYLEHNHNFSSASSSSQWQVTYAKWIQALEKDPVFCPDHERTIYTPIYRLNGLSPEQQADLKTGYLSYRDIIARLQNDKSSGKVSRTGEALLARDFNLAEAVKLLLEAVTQALIRFRQGR